VTVADVLEGRARYVVVHAECESVLGELPDKSVAHVIADPPYGEHVHRSGIRLTARGQIRKRRDTRKLPDANISPCRKSRSIDLGFVSLSPELRTFVAEQCKRLTRRWSVVFSDMEGAPDWRFELEAAGLDFIRYWVWVKDRAMPQLSGDRPGSRVELATLAHPKGRKKWNGGGLGNVSQWPVVLNCAGHRNDRVHTAQKPLQLMEELVTLFTDPDDLILDPFCGSGTTGVAAIRLGRRFIGIEKDPKYAQLARDRIAAEEQGSTLQAKRAGQEPLFR
jgi:site-specific DNA-methyltransferase (adenine-specific)